MSTGDTFGPSNDLPTALQNLRDVLSQIQPVWDYWNARKVMQRKTVESYRDAILASSASDPQKADQIDLLVGLAQTKFVDAPEGANPADDVRVIKEEVAASPRISGDVLNQAATDAQAKLDGYWGWSVAGLAVVPIAVGLVAVGAAWFAWKNRRSLLGVA